MPIYSGKIIKIYQVYGLLSRDSLGLGEPFSTKKWSLKDINIYNIISFKMGPPEGNTWILIQYLKTD